MKYLLIFLIILSFIGPVAQKDKSISTALKDGFYNYMTCLDTSVNYLFENVPLLSKLAQIPYEKTYEKVMDGRFFVKHLVSSGETLDDIIKTYNSNISDIEKFRKVVYNENSDIVSKEYKVQSGAYITIPSE